MIQTETSKAKILLVEVPNFIEEIREMFIHDKETMPLALMIGFGVINFIPIIIPQGNWTILNTLDEVTEDEAEKVMPDFFDVFEQELVYWHKENDGTVFTETAQMALHSLATSLGVEGKTIILYELK